MNEGDNLHRVLTLAADEGVPARHHPDAFPGDPAPGQERLEHLVPEQLGPFLRVKPRGKNSVVRLRDDAARCEPMDMRVVSIREITEGLRGKNRRGLPGLLTGGG